MYLPATYWHDPCQAAAQAVRRLHTPLHYQLRRHDYVAFQRELAAGSNVFVRDECGRTPLDLALLMLEDLLVTGLCTSFPVDFLLETLEYDARYPAKFVPNYAGAYTTLYDHPNAVRLAAEGKREAQARGVPSSTQPFGTGAPLEYPRFAPLAFPVYKHHTLPHHAYDVVERPTERALARLPRQSTLPLKASEGHRDAGGPGEKCKPSYAYSDTPPATEGQNVKRPQRLRFAENQDDSTETSTTASVVDESQNLEESALPWALNEVPSAFQPPAQTLLQRMFQQQMTVVVEDAIQNTTKRQVKRRMNMILSQLKALLRVINLLLTNDQLRAGAIRYRMSIARPPPLQPKAKLTGSAALAQQDQPFFVLETLTFPYLFLATLQNLFEMYPFTPEQTPLDYRNPADARRLVNLVLHKRLKGHEVLHFLAEIPKHLVYYISIMGPHYFKPPPDLAQFLMHMAFCLDSPDLFYFSSRASAVFSVGDLFNWDLLIKTLMPHRHKFASFLIPLITTRLKERIHRRFERNGRPLLEEQSDTDVLNPVYLPFESRYLTQDFFEVFRDLYGTDDLPQLQNMLRWWRYEVARMNRHPFYGNAADYKMLARRPPPVYPMQEYHPPPKQPLPRHIGRSLREPCESELSHKAQTSSLPTIAPLDSRVRVNPILKSKQRSSDA